jgi:hypothetical protein
MEHISKWTFKSYPLGIHSCLFPQCLIISGLHINWSSCYSVYWTCLNMTGGIFAQSSIQYVSWYSQSKNSGSILYFVDCASRHKFLLIITNLMHFFMYLFIYVISLHVLSIKSSSSGDRIVLIHAWYGSQEVPILTSIPSSHLHRLIIPDDVLIQLNLLIMSTWCSKHVERWNK